MDTRLVLHFLIDRGRAPASVDFKDGLLEASYFSLVRVHHLEVPTLLLSIVRIHAEEFCREEGGLITTSTTSDFDDDVLVIMFVFGEEKTGEMAFQGDFFFSEGDVFFDGHGLELWVGGFVVSELGIITHAFFDSSKTTNPFHDGIKFGLASTELGKFFIVTNDVRLAESGLNFLVFAFDSGEEVLHRC